MNVSKKKEFEAIEKLLAQIPDLKEQGEGNKNYRAWKDEADAVVKSIFEESDSFYKDFHSILFPCYIPSMTNERIDYKKRYIGRLDTFKSKLTAMQSAIELWPEEDQPNTDSVELLINTLSRFHKFAKEIRCRHDDRPPIIIKDEYDVQYLVHPILKLFFNDVRKEECTPSNAGGASRIDFLIADESIGVEIKMTRSGLKDKELGEQLIIDRERYKTHYKCKTLICFIYDPEELISNPEGLISDLAGDWNNMQVKVVITPM